MATRRRRDRLRQLPAKVPIQKRKSECCFCGVKVFNLLISNHYNDSQSVHKVFTKFQMEFPLFQNEIPQKFLKIPLQRPSTNSRLFSSKQSHCSHCGKIYCPACNSKVIMGGPMKNRRFKVCHVCHTLLDQTTAPYFSTVPPKPI